MVPVPASPDPDDDPDDATSPDLPAGDDDTVLRVLAEDLAEGIERHLRGWVVDGVEARMKQWSGSFPGAVRDRAEEAGIEATRVVGSSVRTLLGTDVDQQGANPLALVRGLAVPFPTRVLQQAGVPPVVRDEFTERAFPDDPYDLSPASFGDLHPSLQDPGLAWGAAKAYVVLARRRAEGLR
jgi:hypothetical protein